jgi:DNA polymerase I-like protein with 3'-5' exonuclease and polymerase domains
MTAVPRVGSPYGEECRSLFVAAPGYKMVGGDLKGIQLRLLAHYLVPIDGGAFVQEVLHGDPHDGNRVAMGLPEGKEYRDMAKTTIYAVFFGAGPGKVMKILGCSFPKAKATLDLLLQNRPALARFKTKVARLHATRGTLNGPDGRHAFTRSGHSAIATALQLGEAVVMKQATVLLHEYIAEHRLDAKQILCLHDEVQLEVREDQAEEVAEAFKWAVRRAGELFELRIPLEGDVKIGNNWKETH